MGAISCVFIVAQSCPIDNVYLISWLHTQSIVQLLLFDETTFWVRGCLYEKKLFQLRRISHWLGSRWYGKSLLFSLGVYLIKRVGSQRRDLGKWDEQNPYNHFSQPAEIKFNRGAHAYDVRT